MTEHDYEDLESATTDKLRKIKHITYDEIIELRKQLHDLENRVKMIDMIEHKRTYGGKV